MSGTAPVEALQAIATIADAVHTTLDVVNAHRRKALDGGFPPQVADAMGWALWQLMIIRILQAPAATT